MQLLLFILTVCTFIVISIQDFKSRSFLWWLAPLGIIELLLFTYFSIAEFPWTAILSNVLVLLILCLAIYLYSIIRYRSVKSPFDRLIGWGDILFLLLLCAGMNTENYLLFTIITSFSGVVIILIASIFGIDKLQRFPFAGFQAILYLFLVVLVYDKGNSRLFTEHILDSFFSP